MRDAVAASALLERAGEAIGLPGSALDEIFRDTPTDFPVIFSPRLPFRADLLGMTGITLCGRVHLRDTARKLPPADLIVLLRHEAEHVRQQREERLFYLRYLGGWLRGFFRPREKDIQMSLVTRWHRAYMGIPAEREAYGAGVRARGLINRK